LLHFGDFGGLARAAGLLPSATSVSAISMALVMRDHQLQEQPVEYRAPRA